MYLAGTFHYLLGPVWPPTADQCVRPGAWSVGAPCGCLPRGRFAGQHPTGHAGTSMPCRPKSMSGAAMLWLSPPSRSQTQTHGLLIPKPGGGQGCVKHPGTPNLHTLTKNQQILLVQHTCQQHQFFFSHVLVMY